MKLKVQPKKMLQKLFLITGFLLITFSCSEVASTENTPTLFIHYGTGEFHITPINTAVNLIQSTSFSSASFTISPNLPSGLMIDGASGNISGTPTVIGLPRKYTVTALAGGNNYTKIIFLGVSPSQVWVTNVDSSKPYELTVYVVGDRTKQTGVSWSSSDESLATVNNGVVDIKISSTGGDVVITAAKDGNTGTITFNVDVTSYSGSFQASAHSVSGQALVSTNKTQLVLSNFSTDRGPDLKVWVAKSTSPNSADSTSYKSLGALIYADNQSYNLPAGIDLDQYSYVLIWCKRFSVLFGSAQLVKAVK